MKSATNAPRQGYTEVEHVADWELKVWALDLAGLFTQAALGMYALQGISLRSEPRLERTLTLDGLDHEALLVSFLEELLFLADAEGIGFDEYELVIQPGRLHAGLKGAPLASRTKEIKAVTYHRLSIESTASGLEVGIVFDV